MRGPLPVRSRQTAPSWLAQRRLLLMPLLLVAPSVLLVAAFFVAPLGYFLLRSVDNSEVPLALPKASGALQRWDGSGDVPALVFEALAGDLRALADSPALSQLARRLNHSQPGFRSLITRSAARLPAVAPGAGWRAAFVAVDERWGEPVWMQVLRAESGRWTPSYYLAAVDLRLGEGGRLEQVSTEQAVFRTLFVRTFVISATVTALCLMLGFPVALLMARATPGVANIVLMLVLIPFWTSLLVRSTAWVILLQNQGVINQSLIGLGLLEKPMPLIFNRFGLYVAMVHVLLPFMILPLYSVLKGIPENLTRAAASLGAPPWAAFVRIYLPQTVPGVVAGSSLVFVLALGYYITPALVGGPRDQMIGYFIAYFTNSAINWGMAAALGTLLLSAVVLIYAAIGATIGFGSLKVR